MSSCRLTPSPAARTIGDNIRKARVAAGLTRSELAACMGYQGKGANAQIFKVESAVYEPSFKKVQKIASILNVPIPQLMLTSGVSLIRKHRKVKGLTQLALGHAIGLNGDSAGAYICDLEKGVYSPKLSTLQKIAKALDVRLDDLILGPKAKSKGRKK